MRDKELYAQTLGMRSPWRVEKVELLASKGQVKIHVKPDPDVMFSCPNCSTMSPGYDSRQGQWRHLDTWQYKRILLADVPRLKCRQNGILTASVPWADPGSGFTALFEALAIESVSMDFGQRLSLRL